MTSQQPALKWALAAGTDGARVQICRDRSCGTVEAEFDAAGSTAVPPAALAPGVAFWRLYGRRGGTTGTLVSATWEFFVGYRSAPVNTAWGTTLDLNGDGFADVAVGAPGANTVYVYEGSPAGLSSTPVAVTAPSGVSNFGSAVASAGDVNGDGYGDLLVSAQAEMDVYFGSPAGILPTAAARIAAPCGSSPPSIAGLGDFNGDGYADVALGSFGANKAAIYPGGPGGTASAPSITLSGALGFGLAVVGAGDINGDGYGDLLVLESNGNRAWIYYGGPTLNPPFTSIGCGPFTSAAGLGDVNGDGYSDVALVNGSIFNYEGSPTGPTPAGMIAVPSGMTRFSTVAGSGDANADGYDDIVATASGFAYVYLSAGAAGLSGATASYVLNPSPGASCQTAMGCGDVNADGYSDIVCGDASDNSALLRFSRACGGYSSPVVVHGAAGSEFGLAVALADPFRFSGFWGTALSATSGTDGT